MPPGLITVASCLLVPLLSSRSSTSSSLPSHLFASSPSSDSADNFDKLSTSLSSPPSPSCIFLPHSRSSSSARSLPLSPRSLISTQSSNQEPRPLSVCREKEALFHTKQKEQEETTRTKRVSTHSNTNSTRVPQEIDTLPVFFTMQDDGDESVSRHFLFPSSSSSSSSSQYPCSSTSSSSTSTHHYGFPSTTSSSSSSSSSSSATMGPGQYPFPSMTTGSTGSAGQKEREEIKDICDVCQRVLQLATGSSKALGVGMDMDVQMGMMMMTKTHPNGTSDTEGECTCPQHSLISSSSSSSSHAVLSEGFVGPLGGTAPRDPSSRPIVLLSQHLLRTYEAINNVLSPLLSISFLPSSLFPLVSSSSPHLSGLLGKRKREGRGKREEKR